MKTPRARVNRPESNGAALIIVLAFVVILTALSLAYFSRTTTDRQLAQSSFNDTSADLLARSALDIVVSDFKQELAGLPALAASANIQPASYGTPALGNTPIPNLIRRSVSGTGLASSVSSSAVSANGRSVSLARWNSHYLIPRASTSTTIDSTPVSSFIAPDWVLITSQGPNPAPPPSGVIGRYSYAVYDEGGLLDMTLAGYPTWTGNLNANPAPSPTPWQTNVGRKGIVALADLTALPAVVTQPDSTSGTAVWPTTAFSSMSGFPTSTSIGTTVGWRNYATTGQTTSNSTFTFTAPPNTKQNAWGSYLLDFGDPPFTDPSIYPFTSVAKDISSSRTDQAFMTRQELLKLQRTIGFSQSLLQYLGTYSRERNRPAPDWPNIGTHLPDRYDISMLGLVKPNPPGTPTIRGRGNGNGFKGRGRFKGDAGSIRNLFGLAWVAGISTDPTTNLPVPNTDVRYWGHWQYVGTPGLPENPNGNALDHIPVLRGGSTDFFQILDYSLTQANATTGDTNLGNVATVLGLGASLIDQYDKADPGQTDDDADPKTGTHTTIITYSGGFVLGWEKEDDPNDLTNYNPNNPYALITDTGLSTGTKKPLPGFSPIVLDHAFSTVGEFGYALKTANGFARVDFHSLASPDLRLLDFFAYNPVGNAYPRAGIANLNTKNVPVIAAILQSTLKKDIDVPSSSFPNPFPTVAASEAMTAAQAIVNGPSGTTAQPALTRADIVRLTSAAASAISTAGFAVGEETEKVPEAIARALSEMTQTRTWNLMIDVIAQTGKYPPGATQLVDPNDPTKTQFIVQGEKRYWLHIALGRDLVSGNVDVLGTQLEEVTE